MIKQMVSAIITCSLLVFLMPISSLAEEGGGYTLPVEWQKVELQKQIEDRLNKNIQSFARSGKYLVTVDITLSEVKAFGVGGGGTQKPGSKGAADTNQQAFPLSKLGLNKDSSAYKRAISTGVSSIFTQINTVNVLVLLDPSVERSQEGQIREIVNQVVRSYTGKMPGLRVTRTKMLEVEAETAESKMELAKMNVEGMKSVAESIAKSNEKIAEAIAATQGVKLSQEEDEKKNPEKESTGKSLPSSWQEWVIDLKIPIGIVVATLLLVIAISGFKQFESQKVALMAAANAQQAQAAAATKDESEKRSEEKMAEEVSAAVDGNMVLSNAPGGDNGFEQFKRMAEQYAETATYLIKVWLNMNTQESNEALAVLPKMIPVEVLMPVFGALEDEFKSRLKKATSLGVDNNMIKRADAFIIEQMVDTFLVNTIVLPDELKVLLSEMTMDECVECYRQDSSFGSAFMNVLQTSQLGRFFSLLSEPEVVSLFQEGLNFGPENVRYMEENLPKMLEQIRMGKQRVRVPLLDKAIDLIRQLGAEKESQVFDMLIASGNHDQVLEATKKYFPAQLVMKLPSDRLRTLLNRLSPRERAMLIYSRSTDEQELFYQAVGDTGRLREIVDAEIKEIEKDERMKAQILKDQSKIWNRFISTSRETIRKDSYVGDSAEAVLEQWLKDKGVSYSEDQGESAAA